MNKKGFTLIEVLAVITILTILSIIVLPSVFTMIKKSKDNSYNIIVDNFEETARLYATRHRDDVESNLDLYNYYNITLEDLKEDGLLKTPINDPRTDEAIVLSKKIIVTRETDNSLSVCYEDRGCYVPTLLVNELTQLSNIVTGTTQGLHHDTVNDFYYYRGANPNNWIEFNGLLWRIIKVNSDGSVKLIYEGVKNPNGTDQNGTIISRTFDDSNSNAYNNSLSVKTALQNWYDSTIEEDNKSKIQAINFCIGKITYSSTGTLINTFTDNECDTLTSTTLNIGLITGGEYLSASLDPSCLSAYKTISDFGQSCKNNNYLYKPTYDYFTITGDETTTNIWAVKATGSLGIPITANTASNVRPVINLITSVIIDRGTGEFNNPYKLKDIVNVDKEKPSINILGINPIELEKGDSYIDEGATATDNVDGNITDKIVTVSNLNINATGTYSITYVVSDKSGNKRSATRTIAVVEPYIYSASEGVNKPILAEGMTPIKWNGTTWETTQEYDADWYNYTTTDKKWANAKTTDGSMWVWIPRYVYRISSNWHVNSTGTIDIQFSIGTDDTRSGTVTLDTGSTSAASNNKWTNHPGFTFGTTEVSGIWVAKFEASAVEGVANGYTGDSLCPVPGDDVSTKTIQLLPNVASWRCMSVGNAFTAARNMETSSAYGWTTASGLQSNGTYTTDTNNIDTHLMKNVEWGAVAYLSKSSYGKNDEEIYINNNQNYITGCAANSASEGGYNGCKNTYESAGGVKASTTGNIYGIYDLNGSAWEKVSAYVDNGDGNLEAEGSSIINAVSKYKDIYQKNTIDDNANNYLLTANKKGDALWETSSNAIATQLGWFNDYTNMPNASGPWFIRGGYWNGGANAGVFYFNTPSSGTRSSSGFRPVLLVNDGS